MALKEGFDQAMRRLDMQRRTIRRLYFVERQSLGAIAQALGIPEETVRDALVFRSDAAQSLPANPHRKDHEP